jgi:hypothetical protein
MAWRPDEYLIEGELDNSVPGKVTGWFKFVGLKHVVKLDLEGDFSADIRGAKFHLRNPNRKHGSDRANYMEGFSPTQTGKVGTMTGGLLSEDFVAYPYFEWYSEANGRVVLDLAPDEHGAPTPFDVLVWWNPELSWAEISGSEATLPGDTPGRTALGRVAERN